MTTNRMSPMELKPTLLAVLSSLLASPADAVTIDDIMPLVCAELGITEDAWGVVESQASKPNWVRYNTIRSFRALREEGLGEPKGRGQYGLTAKGISAVKSAPAPTTAPTATTAPTTAPTATTAPTITTAAMAIDGGVSWTIGSISDDTYHPDESVREIAISQTPCFGYWAERSPNCQECPLAGSCKRAAFLAFVEIAEGLDTRDSKPEAVQAAQATPVVEAENPVEDAPAESKAIPPSPIIIAPCDLACGRCGKLITAGSSAYWAVDKGQEPMHTACFK